MKRWSSFALALVAAAAVAQAPFTIVRPLDGAHVRETIKIEIPKGSIPENGYIGVFIDGKFIEAVRPPLRGKYFVYDLDTYARHIEGSPAGKPYKLEIVLFTTYNDHPRIVDRSSVDVYVANKSSIPVPNAGFSLRYKWTPGTDLVYDCTTRHLEESITQDQASIEGSRPAEMENAIPEHYRIRYAIDRQFPDADGRIRSDSDGLIRMEAIPDKGKDYIVATDQGSDEPVRHELSEVAPLYMRLTTTGREVWGTIPDLSNSTIVTGNSSENAYFADLPLPTLPVNNVRPGDSWRSRFQDQVPDLTVNYLQRNTLVETFPARGEFVGVEWQMGHPCAVLKDSISESEISEDAKALQAKDPNYTPTKTKEEETLWFSLDTHKLLRMDRDKVTEGTSSTYGLAGGGGRGAGAPGGNGMGGYGAPPGLGGRFPRPGAGGGGGGKGDEGLMSPSNFMQRMPPGMGRGGPGGPGGPGMGFPGGPGGRPGAGAGGNATGQKTIVRTTVHETRILEQ